MDKSPDAFRTISEVAEILETPAHVLRFWESRFPQIKPVKRAGGRRYYRPADVALLSGIRRLLHDDGMTIRGVQKILRENGVRHVAGQAEDSPAAPHFGPPDEAPHIDVEIEETAATGNVVSLSFGRADPAALPEAAADPSDISDEVSVTPSEPDDPNQMSLFSDEPVAENTAAPEIRAAEIDVPEPGIGGPGDTQPAASATQEDSAADEPPALQNIAQTSSEIDSEPDQADTLILSDPVAAQTIIQVSALPDAQPGDDDSVAEDEEFESRIWLPPHLRALSPEARISTAAALRPLVPRLIALKDKLSAAPARIAVQPQDPDRG